YAGQRSKTDQRPARTQIAPLSMLGIPVLEISDNVSGGKRAYPLSKSVTNIGRNPKNDIMINHQSVSGQHLQIIQQGTQFLLIHPHPERKQTLNGLFYRGRKIRGDETFRKVLRPGDLFRIGSEHGSFVTLTFTIGGTESREALPPMRPIRLDSPDITI